MVFPPVCEHPQLPIVRWSKLESRPTQQLAAMRIEMMFRAGVPVRFSMEVAIFDIDPHRQAHWRVRRQILAECRWLRWPGKAKQSRVPVRQHVRREVNLHRVSVPGARFEAPATSRSSL